jgi:hypothetical protein
LASDNVTAAVGTEETITVACIQVGVVRSEDRYERGPCLPIQSIDVSKLLEDRERQRNAALTQRLFCLQEDATDDVGGAMSDPSGIEKGSVRPPLRLGL